MLSGEIYLRLKPYLVVKISSDIVTGHCCQVCVLSMMFCRSDCQLCADMVSDCAICGNSPENHVVWLKGAFTPTRSGSARGCGERFPRGSSVSTSAGPRAISGAPCRGTGSLIYKYRPINASYSCGSRRESLCEQSLLAPAGEAERARGRDPLGRPARFPRWCKCPFTPAGQRGI